jgi:hypothetical protein
MKASLLGNFALHGPIADKNMVSFKNIEENKSASDNSKNKLISAPQFNSPYKNKEESGKKTRNVSPFTISHLKGKSDLTIRPSTVRPRK